jgi:hypothetical protein
MFNIKFMDPQVLWLWVPLIASSSGVLAWYNWRAMDIARQFWGDRFMLNRFSPTNGFQSRVLWGEWLAFLLIAALSLSGPNISQLPEMVPAGSTQVEFIYDVSPSMAAEDYRAFLPPPPDGMPDSAFQFGTRLDAAKYFTAKLLPQLDQNEAGLVTMEGSGYNMWDVTRDLSKTGAFNHVLEKFVQIGSAPGGGSDYTSGIQSALDEFDLITGVEKNLGDTAQKVRFIVLFSDGGFTGSEADLNKVLDEVAKRKVRLLIVALGGNAPITVPKYDGTTGRRNGQYFAGTTKLEPGILEKMRTHVPGSELIYAPPGTQTIDYSFPQQAGGLYARATQSNLRPWLLLVDVLLLLLITAGGGAMPRWRLIDPRNLFANARQVVLSLTSRSASWRTRKRKS